MEPNLELVTGSFFTGMSKAGGVLGERISEASLKRNSPPPFFLWVFVFGVNSHFFPTKEKNFAFYMLTRWLISKCRNVNAVMDEDGADLLAYAATWWPESVIKNSRSARSRSITQIVPLMLL